MMNAKLANNERNRRKLTETYAARFGFGDVEFFLGALLIGHFEIY